MYYNDNVKQTNVGVVEKVNGVFHTVSVFRLWVLMQEPFINTY